LLEIEISSFTNRYTCLHFTYGENSSWNSKKREVWFRNGLDG